MNKTIILASASDRRKQILTEMNLPFVVKPSSYEETDPGNRDAAAIPEYFARNKVLSLLQTLPSGTKENWILGADTAIVFNGELIGKPKNKEEAERFLTKFSGKTHQVVSGVALLRCDTGIMKSATVISDVTVKAMTGDEIRWYLETGEWEGVAGAYRIQESFSRFISAISGSYSGIIGLPISELYDILKELQYPVMD